MFRRCRITDATSYIILQHLLHKPSQKIIHTHTHKRTVTHGNRDPPPVSGNMQTKHFTHTYQNGEFPRIRYYVVKASNFYCHYLFNDMIQNCVRLLNFTCEHIIIFFNAFLVAFYWKILRNMNFWTLFVFISFYFFFLSSLASSISMDVVCACVSVYSCCYYSCQRVKVNSCVVIYNVLIEKFSIFEYALHFCGTEYFALLSPSVLCASLFDSRFLLFSSSFFVDFCCCCYCWCRFFLHRTSTVLIVGLRIFQ